MRGLPSVLAVALFACAKQPATIVLTIDDPNGLASRATRLVFADDETSLHEMAPPGHPFPVVVTIVADRVSGERRIWVEAQATETVLARASTRVTFPKDGHAGSASLVLGLPCEVDTDCNDGVLCNGAKTCAERVCACSPSACGDGVVDPRLEHCEDGNANPNDGCDACRHSTWDVHVVSGIGVTSGNPASVWVSGTGLAVHRSGSLYWGSGGMVFRLDPIADLVTVVGGNGTEFSGDGGPATSAGLSVHDVVVDGLGNVFISDFLNHRVRKIDVAGRITTIAGNGSVGSAGDDGPAINAQLNRPEGLALEPDGALLITDFYENRVRRVDTDGVIRTVAGNGSASDTGDGGPATNAGVQNPRRVRLDPAGGYFVSNVWRVRHVDAGGTITLVAGNGGTGDSGDNGPAVLASFDYIMGFAVHPGGALYIASYFGGRIRRVDPTTGVITTVAGTGTSGFAGDGGPAGAALLRGPFDMTWGANGSLYIEDTGNGRIRVIDPNGTISTRAGGAIGVQGDGGPATRSPVNWPNQVAVDPTNGAVYIADRSNQRVRKVDPQGIITTFAGTGVPESTGDGGPATAASLDEPSGVTVDMAGNVYISEAGSVIRRVDGNGIIHAYAGTTYGYSGDEGPASEAQLGGPYLLSPSPDGGLYVGEWSSNVIRFIDGAGTIHTLAGTAWSSGFSGDNGPGTNAQLDHPCGAVRSGTRLIIAEYSNNRLRALDLGSGVITTFAGTGVGGTNGVGGPAVQAQIDRPCGLAADAAGNVYVAEDGDSSRILKIDASGVLTRVAGTGAPGFDGDFRPATQTALSYPLGIALHGGELVIPDSGNNRIRRIDGSGVVWTIAGLADAVGDGALEHSRLGSPAALTLDPSGASAGRWFIADGDAGFVRSVDTNAHVVATVAGHAGGLTGNVEIASRARLLDDAAGVALDVLQQRIFVSEREGHTLRVVDLAADPPLISTYAGTFQTPGFANGDLATALFAGPSGLAFDEVARLLYVADSENHVVRAIDVDGGTITTVAGSPQQYGFYGEGVLATKALFYRPEALALAADTSIYIADTGNNRVRRIDPGGIINTVLGDGSAASAGVGGPARVFPVDSPAGLALDAFGNLMVTSQTSLRLVTSGADGVATGDDTVTTIFGAPPREAFPEVVTKCLTGAQVIDGAAGISGSVMLLEACQGFLMRLDRRRL